MKITLMMLLLCSFLVASEEIISNSQEWKRPVIIPTPKDNLLTTAKITLGKKLFFDTMLSRDYSISCASCHQPKKAWSDGISLAIGDKKAEGKRNSPSILNVAYQFIYFWDGRAKSLEEQSLAPLESHVEMNLKPQEAIERLKKEINYKKLFAKAFPKEEISTATLAKALASFERSIVSGKSRFDRWIAGEKHALNKQETEGFYLFTTKANCTVCHSTFRFSDQSFNNVGINNKDKGRGEIKKRAIWQGTFKTPTLRDIANTAPYFHDGSIPTLKEAVAFCAKGEREKKGKVSPILIDKKLNEKEIINIVSFLKTLSEPSFE